MIQIQGLCKSYRRNRVLDGLSLDLLPGQVTALLGPNGAGKTTLVKCLMGLVRADKGTVCWQGVPLSDEMAWKGKIGYMPQHPKFPENVRVEDLVRMLVSLRGSRAHVETEWAEITGLNEHMGKLTRELSGGNRQKLSALLTLLFRPEILFLDEPTAGMDPVTGNAFKDRVKFERDRGCTVILTSHVLSEVEQMADRVVYLMGGRIVIDASMDDLMADAGNLQRAVAARLAEVPS